MYHTGKLVALILVISVVHSVFSKALQLGSQRFSEQITKNGLPQNNKSKDHADPQRSRRSPSGEGGASPEIQALMSGNWNRMDPESLFKFLSSFSPQNQPFPLNDDYEELYDEDPIDLVYSGRKPMLTASPIRGQSRPKLAITSPHFEPISLMSSGGSGKSKFRPEEQEVISSGRLIKMKRRLPFLPFQRDLVQLPSGGIAFSTNGLRILQNHPPSPIEGDEVPFARRLVLKK